MKASVATSPNPAIPSPTRGAMIPAASPAIPVTIRSGRRGDGHVRAPHRVAGGHVDDLMTQDAGQLVLGIRQGQQPPRDVDVPVGSAKAFGSGWLTIWKV